MAANDITLTQKGAGKIWVGLSVPAASAELVIGADGTPDAMANPNAKVLGLTEKGSILSLGKQVQEEFFDEYKQALERTIDQTMASIKADVSQILDWDVVEAMTIGVGTVSSPVGKKKVAFGESAISYSGVAVIFPLKSDSAKFGVWHLYKAFQTNNVDIPISRQERAKASLEFKGVAIATRALTDNLGAYWKQV